MSLKRPSELQDPNRGVKENEQGCCGGSSDGQEVQFNHSRLIVAVLIEQAMGLLEEGGLGRERPYWVAWGQVTRV